MLKLFPTLILKHPAGHFQSVIKPIVLYDIVKRLDGAGFGVIGTVNKAVQPSQYHRSGTHRARFQCHVNGTTVQPPVTDVLCRLRQGDDFRVSGWVVQLFPLVVRFGDDAIFLNNDAADRHITVFLGNVGLINRHLHILFIN